MNNGRDKLDWSQEIWNRIDQAVHDEVQRTKVAAQFLPLHGPIAAGETTILSDTIKRDEETLTVDEARTTPLIELYVEFKLTPQQVEREEELMTAVTLATRAANLLSQAEDVVLFQGRAAVQQHPLFSQKKVRVRSGPAGLGMVCAPWMNPDSPNLPKEAPNLEQIVIVQPRDGEDPKRYGEKTFKAVSEAYSILQGGRTLQQAHYGPYALVLRYEPYADTYAPLEKTLIMPADRIKSLVTEGFYGTGTMPPRTGMLVSLGGNTMDLVVGMDATTAFLQEDPAGQYVFRVYERFALRLKDPSAIITLLFEESPGELKEHSTINSSVINRLLFEERPGEQGDTPEVASAESREPPERPTVRDLRETPERPVEE